MGAGFYLDFSNVLSGDITSVAKATAFSLSTSSSLRAILRFSPVAQVGRNSQFQCEIPGHLKTWSHGNWKREWDFEITL